MSLYGSALWGSIASTTSSAVSSSSGSSADSGALPSTVVEGYNTAANDAHFNAKTKFPGQLKDLSLVRTLSTIPKADFTPQHQPVGDDKIGKWVYPSEQQYFNAMKRKGYNPREEDVAVILAIHNSVNELGWKRILEWEALRGCKTPTLKRFLGRPKDLSPKARILVALGKDPPFDRHDWIIEREDGKEVRYVLDFYSSDPAASSSSTKSGSNSNSNSNSTTAAHAHGASSVPVHIDVRPALDSPGALFDRIQFSLGIRAP